MKEAKEFMNNYELFKVNDHKSIMLICVYDIDKMQIFMSTTDILKQNEAKNSVDNVYFMERINYVYSSNLRKLSTHIMIKNF